MEKRKKLKRRENINNMLKGLHRCIKTNFISVIPLQRKKDKSKHRNTTIRNIQDKTQRHTNINNTEIILYIKEIS